MKFIKIVDSHKDRQNLRLSLPGTHTHGLDHSPVIAAFAHLRANHELSLLLRSLKISFIYLQFVYACICELYRDITIILIICKSYPTIFKNICSYFFIPGFNVNKSIDINHEFGNDIDNMHGVSYVVGTVRCAFHV